MGVAGLREELPEPSQGPSAYRPDRADRHRHRRGDLLIGALLVVEEGTHHELVEAEGTYRELYDQFIQATAA